MTINRLVLLHLLFGTALAIALQGCGPQIDPEAEPEIAGGVDDDTARTVLERGPVKVCVEITPKKARLSDEPILTLTVDAAQGVEISMPPFGESLGPFIVRDFREPLPEIKEDRVITRQIYTLEPSTTGALSIYPIPFTFVDRRPDGDGKEHALETEGLTIDVQTALQSEVPDLAALKPAAGPLELPGKAPTYLWWTVAGGLVLLTALFVFIRTRRRQKAIPIEKKYTPKELAFLEFQQLLEQNLIEVDLKLFYVELTGIVRRYIERTTGIRAPEQTTEEFLHEIGRRPVFSGHESERLQRFLEAADLVKFAAFEPRKQEIEESFVRAKTFVGLEKEEAAL